MAKILIVEDSKLVVTMLKKYLSTEEHEITVANCGTEALELLKGDLSPDIILLDIVMEDMDGFELIQQLKTEPGTKEIPVLFVTSLDKGSDINKGLELGANDYIIKPFTPNEIKNKVNSNLKK